jgi:hypothetical protein
VPARRDRHLDDRGGRRGGEAHRHDRRLVRARPGGDRQQDRREKRGWSTDFPGADINFSIRLSELTKTRTIKQPSSTDPEYVVVRLTDKALFKCPYLLMEDAGTMALSDAEVASFRDYFLKGGFAFVSDTWGEYAREQFDEEIGRVLPPDRYPIAELPINHPIWRS